MLAALALAACRSEVRRGEVPVDTAAVPMLDTATRAAGALTAPAAPGAAPDTLLATGAPSAALGVEPGGATVVLAADSAAGDSIFHGKGRCFTCHGMRGEGAPGLAPSLVDSTWLNGGGSYYAMADVIARGVAVPKAAAVAMPAYAGTLTPEEIARTAAYVYALSHPGATIADTTRDTTRTDSTTNPDTLHIPSPP